MSSPFSAANSPDDSSEYPSVTPTIGQAAHDLRIAAAEKAREIAHTAESKAIALKDRAVESAHHLREIATEKAQHFKENANEQWQGTREKAKEIHITSEDYIRENPTKCVLGALGAGFLIGLIVRR